VVGLTVWFYRGLYVGRDQGERPEEHPTTARLHAALVAAAASLPGGLTPNKMRALEWLESNPPRYLSIPETVPADNEPLFHYRNTGRTYLKNVSVEDATGTGKKSKAVIDLQKARVRYLYGTVMLGPVCWGWDVGDVPEDVAAVLADLAARVFYLGSAESHARMHWGPVHAVTHRAHGAGERIGLGAKDVQAPRPGRTGELVELNRKLAAAREASIARDRKARAKVSDTIPTTDGDKAQKAQAAGLDLRQKVGVDWYAPANWSWETEETDDLPWPRAVWIPLSKAIGTADRARVAYRLHGALVNLFAADAVGAEVPAWVTGHHEYEFANNVAYQYIPPFEVTGARHSRGTSGGMLVLLPPECDPPTRDKVAVMAGEFWPLRGYGPGSPVPVNPGQWWLPPADGGRRLWRTYPLMLSDTRGKDMALALAVKHLFRSRAQPPRYAVITASRRDNFQIGDFYPTPRRRRTADPATGTAKREAPVTGYTAVIALDDTVSPCAALALGKTRHMGGGLLLPVDVPDLKATTR
jgi:CRISPR-associated protein Csb2